MNAAHLEKRNSCRIRQVRYIRLITKRKERKLAEVKKSGKKIENRKEPDSKNES